MKCLFANITKKEWAFIVALSFIIIIFIAIYPVVAFFITRDGYIFNGTRGSSFSDIYIYFGYINQIIDGNYLIRNNYSTTLVDPGVFNVAWLFVGLVGRLFNLSAAWAYSIVKIVLVPLGIVSLYALIKEFDFGEYKTKVVVFFITFASGIGLFFPYLRTDLENYYIVGSMDLWDNEVSVFQSFLHSPHFILSYIGLFLSVLFIVKFIKTNHYRYMAYGGVVSLIWFNFHPYYIPYMWAFVLVLWLVLLIVKKNSLKNLFLSGLLYFIITLPSFGYSYYLTFIHPYYSLRNAQNITMTPNIVFVIMGFFFLIVFAIPAFIRLLRKREKTAIDYLIIVWVIILPILAYVPINFQRRMLMGWGIPLSILTVQQIEYFLLKKGKSLRAISQNYAIYGFAFLILFATAVPYSTIRDIYDYQNDQKGYMLATGYHSVAFDNIMNYLRDNNSYGEGVIAPEFESIMLASFASQKVFLGSGSETVDYQRKKDITASILAGNYKDIEILFKDNNLHYMLMRGNDLHYNQFKLVFESEPYFLYIINP